MRKAGIKLRASLTFQLAIVVPFVASCTDERVQRDDELCSRLAGEYEHARLNSQVYAPPFPIRSEDEELPSVFDLRLEEASQSEQKRFDLLVSLHESEMRQASMLAKGLSSLSLLEAHGCEMPDLPLATGRGRECVGVNFDSGEPTLGPCEEGAAVGPPAPAPTEPHVQGGTGNANQEGN